MLLEVMTQIFNWKITDVILESTLNFPRTFSMFMHILFHWPVSLNFKIEILKSLSFFGLPQPIVYFLNLLVSGKFWHFHEATQHPLPNMVLKLTFNPNHSRFEAFADNSVDWFGNILILKVNVYTIGLV